MMSLASSPSQRWDRIVAAIRWEERKMEVSVSVLQDKMNSGVASKGHCLSCPSDGIEIRSLGHFVGHSKPKGVTTAGYKRA